MDILIIILVIIAVLAFLVWLGLQIKPAPFPAFPAPTVELEMRPFPQGLPPPVERLFRKLYGDRLPLIHSAVVSGSAQLRLFGIPFPGRFRFIHNAGKDYRHYIEVTFFGLPVMKVNEYYLDGKGRMELPFGVVEDEPKINQAANQGLWAESFWLPAILVTDPRVRWEAVDQETALLRVPWGEQEQTFVVRFDPDTGLLRYLETMRYRDAKDERKILWINDVSRWRDYNGTLSLETGSLTWLDQGKPWAVFSAQEIVYNPDVSTAIHASGP